MPATAYEHWDYTLREWNGPFKKLLVQIEPPKVVYDVGANVGGFTKVVLDLWFPEVHAFEPVERNYKAFEEYIGKDATLHKFGIYYGFRDSHVQSRGDGNIGAFFVEHIDAGEPRITDAEVIQLRTFEELDIPKPDLIKMDIEGAEENVLEFSDVCRDCPNLIIEWHPPVEPVAFFKKHLPNHRIVDSIDNIQFLLCKSQ